MTHQLEEAIETSDRLLVFGKPAILLADLRLSLADLRLSDRRSEDLSAMRTRIQTMLESDKPDPELGQREVVSR